MCSSLQIAGFCNSVFLELNELKKFGLMLAFRIKNSSPLSLCLYFFWLFWIKRHQGLVFMCVCFVPFFCFNSPYQFTSLLNLYHVIFTLTPFGWFICICLSLFLFAVYNQQDATFHNLFISVRRSTCFRRFFHPSSGAQNSTYSVRYWSDKYLMLYVLFGASDDGRKNCLKHVERLTEINKLWNVASCWLYSASILAMHEPMNVKFLFPYWNNVFYLCCFRNAHFFRNTTRA